MTSMAVSRSLNPARSLALLIWVSLISSPAFASTDLIEEAHFAGPGHSFAVSTALSGNGNVAVFGSVEAICTDGEFCGAAYVYRRVGASWNGPEILTAGSPEAWDLFGQAVAISGDGERILAGAPNDRCTGTDIPCGAAYLFVREGNTWSAPTRVVGSDTVSFDKFGISVAMSADGTTALIGDHFHACPGAEFCGAAYVFVRQEEQWVEEQQLLPRDQEGFDFFGLSVALSADGATALVGSPEDQCSMGIACGAGYLFKRDNSVWSELTKLIPSAPTGFDLAGTAVALSSDASVALLGSYASGCSGEPSQCGGAYVFADTDGWSEEKHLLVPQGLDPAVELEFGFSVTLSASGETALIGANCPFWQIGGLCAKRAFIYSRSGGDWPEQQRLAPANGDPDGRFGYAVSLAADTSQAIVASSRAVYLYSAKLFTDGFESGDTSVWSLTVD